MYNLLVVDDESIIRRGIRAFVDLISFGIEHYFEAENGEDALRLMREHKIHIIFADINMPKMNGLEFAKKAREIDCTVKIAMITGYDYFDYAQSAIKIGVDDYILKPVSREDVQKLLIKLIEKKKAEEGLVSLKLAVDVITRNANSPDESSVKEMLAVEIEKNIGNTSFSLNCLAADMGYSVPHLSTIFKKNFGENFRDYLLELRLERAKILLLSTNMKNYEISVIVGIDDPNYFSACFKRKYHMTTKDYKNNTGVRPDDSK